MNRLYPLQEYLLPLGALARVALDAAADRKC
jgi:hypothetical protein